VSGLVLASGSAIRAQLLRDAGVRFEIARADIDEAVLKQVFRAAGKSAADCALALADAKARHVVPRYPDSLVIGADQILVCADEWFDKPPDLAAARVQLQQLRGRTHELATAVCVLRNGDRLWAEVQSPKLTMRGFSDRFLDGYIGQEGEGLLSSVGAYRLEGSGVQLFAGLEGSYFAVLGLPLIELLGFLRESGVLQS
jgi:septum formation protein